MSQRGMVLLSEILRYVFGIERVDWETRGEVGAKRRKLISTLPLNLDSKEITHASLLG